jgi:hypothetical protein
MGARSPWSPIAKEEAARPGWSQRPSRLPRARQQHLRDSVADILRTGEPTLFCFEAACRHGVRVSLILSGWRWSRADEQAAAIVALALALLGAKRPTWQQGQPDYCQEGTIILRERCLHCGKPLLNMLGTKYCDEYCRTQWHSGMAATLMAKDGDAYRIAARRAGGLDEQHNA